MRTTNANDEEVARGIMGMALTEEVDLSEMTWFQAGSNGARCIAMHAGTPSSRFLGFIASYIHLWWFGDRLGGTLNQRVGGSSPPRPTNRIRRFGDSPERLICLGATPLRL